MTQKLDDVYAAQVAVESAPIKAVYDEANAEIADGIVQLTAANLNINQLQSTAANLNTALTAAEAQEAADAQKIAALQAQLAAVPAAPVVYEALEYGPWGVNFLAQVGGSGLGTARFSPPGVETAELAIAPTPPAAGTSNYFDCYFSQTFPADASKTKFKFETSWLFPTAADAAASQCLEMEARQVAGGKMFVMALQLQFSGGQLRYWDDVKKWTAFGHAQPRLTPGTWYKIMLEAHRDNTNVTYDAVTVNGVRTPLPFSYVAQTTTWREMTRAALQPDGNGAGVPYRVKIDGVRLTTS